MAWISTDEEGPASTFITKGGSAPYALVDNTVVADNWADLTDGSLDHAIDLDASGMSPGGSVEVWSNTVADGTPKGGDLDCDAWTHQGGGKDGWIGKYDQSGLAWTDDDNSPKCDEQRHIYCFQQ